ncbi:hypothetical protein DWW59_13545 [Firmicutes bacterium AF16-15]|nr:hypothetical protein DWW59_13545 [Firmicutes bacterium AF16-15]
MVPMKNKRCVSVICFSGAISERAACTVGNKARFARACGGNRQREKQNGKIWEDLQKAAVAVIRPREVSKMK